VRFLPPIPQNAPRRQTNPATTRLAARYALRLRTVPTLPTRAKFKQIHPCFCTEISDSAPKFPQLYRFAPARLRIWFEDNQPDLPSAKAVIIA